MGKFRLELNIPGFNEARADPAIMSDLLSRGQAIANATGSPDDFEVIASPHATRARVVVVPATPHGAALEASGRVLEHAFDAGRS